VASPSRNKAIGQLKQAQYSLLRSLTDGAVLDAASLERSVMQVVRDRFMLARGCLKAAAILLRETDPLVRRSAVSRAYYAAYHAARATVFAVHRHDEDSHKELPQTLKDILGESAGDTLKELRRLRDEMEYSPYPGPRPQTAYTGPEIEGMVKNSVRQARTLVANLEKHLKAKR
jgi:uncharacterized protein (UPF0332 family)